LSHVVSFAICWRMPAVLDCFIFLLSRNVLILNSAYIFGTVVITHTDIDYIVLSFKRVIQIDYNYTEVVDSDYLFIYLFIYFSCMYSAIGPFHVTPGFCGIAPLFSYAGICSSLYIFYLIHFLTADLSLMSLLLPLWVLQCHGVLYH
jgi:hypothetical protein